MYKKRRYLIIAGILLFWIGCKQKGIDKNEVLNDLKEYYYSNKIAFDSLTVYLADSTTKEDLIRPLTNIMRIKTNSKGYKRLYYSDLDSDSLKKTFYVKEIGYSTQYGFQFRRHEKREDFENPRLVFRRIEGDWFAYIYFN